MVFNFKRFGDAIKNFGKQQKSKKSTGDTSLEVVTEKTEEEPSNETEQKPDEESYNKTENKPEEETINKTPKKSEGESYNKAEKKAKADDKRPNKLEKKSYNKEETKLEEESYNKEKTKLEEELYNKEEIKLEEESYNKEEPKLEEESYNTEETKLEEELYNTEEKKLEEESYNKEETKLEKESYNKSEENLEDDLYEKTQNKLEEVPYNKTEKKLEKQSYIKTEELLHNKTENNLEEALYNKTEKKSKENKKKNDLKTSAPMDHDEFLSQIILIDREAENKVPNLEGQESGIFNPKRSKAFDKIQPIRMKHSASTDLLHKSLSTDNLDNIKIISSPSKDAVEKNIVAKKDKKPKNVRIMTSKKQKNKKSSYLTALSKQVSEIDPILSEERKELDIDKLKFQNEIDRRLYDYHLTDDERSQNKRDYYINLWNSTDFLNRNKSFSLSPEYKSDEIDVTKRGKKNKLKSVNQNKKTNKPKVSAQTRPASARNTQERSSKASIRKKSTTVDKTETKKPTKIPVRTNKISKTSTKSKELSLTPNEKILLTVDTPNVDKTDNIPILKTDSNKSSTQHVQLFIEALPTKKATIPYKKSVQVPVVNIKYKKKHKQRFGNIKIETINMNANVIKKIKTTNVNRNKLNYNKKDLKGKTKNNSKILSVNSDETQTSKTKVLHKLSSTVAKEHKLERKKSILNARKVKSKPTRSDLTLKKWNLSEKSITKDKKFFELSLLSIFEDLQEKQMVFAEDQEKYQPKQCRTCHGSDTPIQVEDDVISIASSNLWSVDENEDTDFLVFKDETEVFIPENIPTMSIDKEEKAKISEFKETFNYALRTIDEGKQLYILNVYSLMPSEALLEHITSSNDVKSLKLKWTFLNYADEAEFPVQNEIMQINVYRQYPFYINETFYLYLLRVGLAVHLYSIHKFGHEEIIGRCDISFVSALRKINHMYEARIEVDNHLLTFCFKNMTMAKIGTLVCRYTLKGNQKKFDECKPNIAPLRIIEPLIEETYDSLYHNAGQDLDLPEIHDAELKLFQDGLNLVLLRNKALKIPQVEITNELKERTTWIHQELHWRLTLQEHAILTGKDPNSVKWRQWKDETTSFVRYRELIELSHDKSTVLEITIVELQLNLNSQIYTDPSVMQIYIEYSFLNTTGAYLETESMFKPDDESPIVYNFHRTFTINNQGIEAKLLSNMIQNNDCITFNIVSQPVESSKIFQTCMEVASCQINMQQLIQHQSDIVSEHYSVIDDRQNEVGKLKIIISGIVSIRSLALNYLTPDDFQIIR